MMTEKQVFTKDNLSELLRLQADALDRGEVLEFEEGKIDAIDFRSAVWTFNMSDNGWTESITLKPKPQLRKATTREWLLWACSDDCKGWAVKEKGCEEKAPQHFDYLNMTNRINEFKRAKFENGKLGEFEYFWKEV